LTRAVSSPGLTTSETLLVATAMLCTAALYRTVVPNLVREWWNDPNFSHGFLVPLVSAWLIWEKRAELQAFSESGSALPGLALVFAGALMFVVGTAAGEYFTMRSSLVFVVAGLFRIVFGRRGFRSCLFPIAFLLFMVPIPYIFYDSVAFPLRMVASWVGEHSLAATGVPVFREGTIIALPNLRLEVADACSGVRSLMSLFALTAVIAYVSKMGLAKGGALLLSAIPVSIFTNSLRIYLTGVLSYTFGRRAAEGFFHNISGLLIFAIGVLLLFLLGRFLGGPRRTKHHELEK
jgi:exosortase